MAGTVVLSQRSQSKVQSLYEHMVITEGHKLMAHMPDQAPQMCLFYLNTFWFFF